MTEFVVFFSKHAVFNVLAFYVVNVNIPPKICHIKLVPHPNCLFGVIFSLQPFLCPFFSFKKIGNVHNLKNINYNKSLTHIPLKITFSFFQFKRFMLALFGQGVSIRWVSVRGYLSGGYMS